MPPRTTGKKKRDPISGTWYSKVGSTLKLEVKGSVLTGTFDSTEARGAGPRPLQGTIDPHTSLDNRALSFSVLWAPTAKYPASVTSYTGQFQVSGGPDESPHITTVFLLATETEPKDNYKAVTVGYDNFYREYEGAELPRPRTSKGQKKATTRRAKRS